MNAEVEECTLQVDQINTMEPALQKLSDEELRAKTGEFKARLSQGETLEDLLPEAFAVRSSRQVAINFSADIYSAVTPLPSRSDFFHFFSSGGARGI